MRSEDGRPAIVARVETTSMPHASASRSVSSTCSCVPLDQDELIRAHAPQILPLLLRAVFNAVRFAVAVGVLECDGHDVSLAIDARVVAQRERPVERGVVDRAPEVDDLEAVVEQGLHVGGREVLVHTRDGRLRCLIDVHLGHRLTLRRRIIDFARVVTTDR